MKLKRLLILFMICLAAWPLGAQAGFSTDADAIEEAAKSVLMLGNYVGDELIGTGSGFVAFDSQTLITNHHVIKGAQYIIASDDAGNFYELDKVYCASERMDIAILGFKKPTALKPLAIGTGNDLKRGEPVVAIGSPQGLKNTVSTGVVSYVINDGAVPQIQFSAPISQGSSGGALFNDAGHVVGITSSILMSGQNLNFAVQGSVPLALYAGWTGKAYSLSNWPNESLMDFKGGERLAVSRQMMPSQAEGDWLCPACGHENSMNFCAQCGTARPQWQCACGQSNMAKFCVSCGKSQEALLNDLNAALTLLENGEYEQAISALEALGQYNCGGLTSKAGNNAAAKDQIAKAYYQWGEAFEKEKNYLEASLKYGEADRYADAPQKMLETGYLYAGVCYDEGRYLAASEFYLALGDYKDASAKALESAYKLGETYIAENNEDEGIEVFTALEGYKDSGDRIKEAYCHKGNRLAELGVFGEAITAYEAAGDYEAAREGLKRTHYLRAEALLVIMDYAEAIKAFKQAGDYQDAQARVKATYYLEGEYHLSKENWEKAKQAFEKAGDYQDAEERLRKLNFEQGEQALANSDWHAAIKYFAACSTDDSLAREKLTQAYNHQIKAYVDAGSVSQAHACYQQGIEAGCTLEDVAVAMPGSKSNETLKVLTMARDMGFIKKLDKNEDTYDEKYAEGILKMETALGLTADGSISVSEWDSLEKTVYPGGSGEHVKALLEKLCDLEYIDKLADDHRTYTSKLKKSVQKAEKALGLTDDGILTLDEQTVILDLEVAAPGPVSNVKVKVSKGDVTLSWSKVKGARYYTIFRDGKQIGRTESTKYTDKEAVMGEFHTYEVAANKYTCASKQKSWNHVYVEPSYESVSLKNIWAHSTASYIEISGVRRQAQMWKGDDLIMLVYKKIDGTKYWMYLRFENYNTAWDWNNGGIAEQRGLDTISAKGRTDGYVKYAMDSSSRVLLDVESVKWTH